MQKKNGYLDFSAKQGKSKHDDMKKIFKYGKTLSIDDLKKIL